MAPMMMMLVYNINSNITNSRDSINWQIFGITQDSLCGLSIRFVHVCWTLVEKRINLSIRRLIERQVSERSFDFFISFVNQFTSVRVPCAVEGIYLCTYIYTQQIPFILYVSIYILTQKIKDIYYLFYICIYMYTFYINERESNKH